MCIGSNSVNQAQDLMFVTKFEDFPNSLLPNGYQSAQYSLKDHYSIDVKIGEPYLSNTRHRMNWRCQ